MLKIDIEKKLKKIDKMERFDKKSQPFVLISSVISLFLFKFPFNIVIPAILIFMYSVNIANTKLLKKTYLKLQEQEKLNS